MFNSFCEIFFGTGYQPNDFELAFAFVFLLLIFHGISALINSLKNGVK